MHRMTTIVVLAAGLLAACTPKCENKPNNENMNSTLEMTQEWDKTFAKSEKVEHRKVTFKNRYGIELAADLYSPKGSEGKLPAIAVSGPFGAVKEQSSGLYAQHMAEMGFLAIAFIILLLLPVGVPHLYQLIFSATDGYFKPWNIQLYYLNLQCGSEASTWKPGTTPVID